MKCCALVGLVLALFSFVATTIATPVRKLDNVEDAEWMQYENADLVLNNNMLQELLSHSFPSMILDADDLSTDNAVASSTNNYLRLPLPLSQESSNDQSAIDKLKNLSDVESVDEDLLKYPELDSVMAAGKFRPQTVGTALGNSEMKKRTPEGELLKKLRELQRKNNSRQLNNEIMMAVYQQLLNVK